MWHKHLGHISLKTIQKAITKNVISGLPTLTCTIGLFVVTASPVNKFMHLISKFLTRVLCILELLYLDFMGPMQSKNLEGKHYVLAVIDDFSW